MANVQISRELWDNLCDFFLENQDYLFDDICCQLLLKIQKQQLRSLYGEYKSSSGSQRELLRNAYLDSRGVAPAFRTSEEWHDKPPEE